MTDQEFVQRWVDSGNALSDLPPRAYVLTEVIRAR